MKKHPLLIRLVHWINFPLLLMMIWSGCLIYWANNVYWPHLPDRFYEALNLDHRLAAGMAIHFFFMWFFVLNGLIYVSYLIFSGTWRDLVPQKRSFAEGVAVFLHDIGLGQKISKTGKFNGAQRIAYTSAIFVGAGLVFSGLAIYKPIQLGWLKNLFGGYEMARQIHYYLMMSIVIFFFIHLVQVTRSGWNNFQAMVTGYEDERNRLRPPGSMAAGNALEVPGGPARKVFAFSVLSLFLLLFGFGFLKMNQKEDLDGIPKPFRKSLELNEWLGLKILNPEKTDSGVPPVPKGKNPRTNGDLGLNPEFVATEWTMEVISPLGSRNGPVRLQVKMEDLKKLPRTEILTQFKCIEGWSENMSFAGVRFVDFLRAFHLGTHSGAAANFRDNRQDLYSHVGLETPDGQYYVSVDMKSMLSPDTLLAYEMNGFPLTPDHGAPLRLVLTNKYGVKSLKRIGKISFADHKLPDYWGEQGYDWFIGL